MKRKTIIFFVMTWFFIFSGQAETASNKEEEINRKGLEITVYNQNIGLVKDSRIITLDSGENDVIWPEVSAQIDPTSVSYTADRSWVLEQNYQYDLVSRNVLLSKYIGHEVTIVERDRDGRETDRYSGTVLSVENDRISSVMVDGKVILDPQGQVILPSLPEGLLIRPTLVFKLAADKKCKEEAEISYITTGLNWKADYIAVLNETDTNLDLDGWVTVDNQSGATYPDAKLKLIAGDIHLIKEARPRVHRKETAFGAGIGAREPQFQESGLFEYHMYTMQRPTTIKQKETKQISFIEADNARCTKLFIYDPEEYYQWWWHWDEDRTKGQKIMVKVEVENKKEDNLGMPLPKGKVRIYKKDQEGALQFVGEDTIDHTPRDEKVRLYVGDAFDIVGQRTIKNSKSGDKTLSQDIEINIRNHKDENVIVNIIEHLRHSNWKITKKSNNYKKTDAWTVEFMVEVPARDEITVEYSFRAWWH